ncbi:MAG: hypothetical protein Q4F07_09510 [Bacteroidales bacterium]|nr:hypothetical protein [Bacteroidales bacterium]
MMKAEIQNIESRILAITAGKNFTRADWMNDKKQRCKVEQLLSQRQELLNKMFLPTAEAMEHFKVVNNRLFTLSGQLRNRIRVLNEKINMVMDCPEFDDDYEIEGSLRFSFNGEESVLKLDDDSYYGSNFIQMIELLNILIHRNTDLHPLECIGLHSTNLDDGQSWDEYPFRGRKEFDNIIICYAIHNFTSHLGYSIPDLIRMNDFWCEVHLIVQSITTQNGTRYIPNEENNAI